MGFQIYLASSWNNAEAVKKVMEILRAYKLQVYCFAEKGVGLPQFNWPDAVDVTKEDGITALETMASVKAFKCDKWWLGWANCCVLILPSGRDSHLEAGYIKGKGGNLYIVGEFPVGEYSNLYHLADGLYRWGELTKLIDNLLSLDAYMVGEIPKS